MKARECSFEVNGLRLHALHWGGGENRRLRLLALHGWLDNAASFLGLAEALPDCEILAPDLAGHGRSDWRPVGGSYALVDHLPDLMQLLDTMGWADCILLGHSMGAAIASLMAVAAPERCSALLSIDALGPLSLTESEAAARLRRAFRARGEPTPKRRLFASVEDATAQRAQLNGLRPDQARALVERALKAVDGGWIWAADPRLQLPSALPLSETQVQALLAAIACPVLVLAAETPDPRLPRLEVKTRLGCVPQAVCLRLAGGHHLHIAEPAKAAAAIQQFIREHCPT
ncbi:MAG: alpha/beta hydrolase [Aquimonas sp.]|nr:alpha/beta hydrolase [Aquimonas sp.]